MIETLVVYGVCWSDGTEDGYHDSLKTIYMCRDDAVKWCNDMNELLSKRQYYVRKMILCDYPNSDKE